MVFENDSLEEALETLGEPLASNGQPTSQELRDAAAWCRTHDPSDGFHQVLEQALATFGVHDESQ
jgi:hypothetical protein